jgi:hypothetical protein
MLTNRFGVLGKAMPNQITIAKTCALVNACCKLHNYCIDNNDEILEYNCQDPLNISIDGGIAVSKEYTNSNDFNNHEFLPDKLIDTGNHNFGDHCQLLLDALCDQNPDCFHADFQHPYHFCHICRP